MIIIWFEIALILIILIRHLQRKIAPFPYLWHTLFKYQGITMVSQWHCLKFNTYTHIWIPVYMAKRCHDIFLSPSWTFCFHPSVAHVWISESIVQFPEVHAPWCSEKDCLYLPNIDPIFLDPHKCPQDEFWGIDFRFEDCADLILW